MVAFNFFQSLAHTIYSFDAISHQTANYIYENLLLLYKLWNLKKIIGRNLIKKRALDTLEVL